MSYYPTQEDINVIFQGQKQIYSKVEILNQNYSPIKSIEGELISDSYNVDSSSNVRRTYNCNIRVSTPILEFDMQSDFWFNKYLRPYVGIYDLREKIVKWYLKGTYSSANATHQYDESNNTLQVTCNDLMCRLTGDVDGQERDMTGAGFTLPAGTNIRDAIIATIKEFGFTTYKIDSLPRETTTYDLEFGAGTTAYSVIEQLLQFEPNYEFFFDIDGTFVVQKMPCYTDTPDIISQAWFEKALVSQNSYNVTFNAKNCIEVWGKSWGEDTVDRVASSATYANNTYTLTFEDWIKDETFTVAKSEQMDTRITVSVNKEMFVKHVPNQSNGYRIEYKNGSWIVYLLIQNDKDLYSDDQILATLTTQAQLQDWGISVTVPSGAALVNGDHINVSAIYPRGIPYNYFICAAEIANANSDNPKMIINTDRVLTYSSYSQFPSGGREDKYYKANDTGKIYRYVSGSGYSEISQTEIDDLSHGPYNIVNDYGKGIKAGEIQPGNMYVFEYLENEGYEYPGMVCAANKVRVYGVSAGSVYEYSYSLGSDYPVGTRVTVDLNKSSGNPSTYSIAAIKQAGQIIFLGGTTIHATYQHHNDSYLSGDISSKFTVENMGKEYWGIFSGGEYENITSDSMARERAMYECYYKANMNESLSLTLLDIPWLDVNTRVTYKRRGSAETERWIIQNFSSDTAAGTCSVSLVRFYPDWSKIFRDEYI